VTRAKRTDEVNLWSKN